MAAFFAIAALLGVVVFALMLRPLWRESRAVALGVGLLALLSVGLLYRLVGTPQALDPVALRGPQTLSEAITQLEAALREHPDQAEGWALLAQAYQRENKLPQARDALARAAQLAPDNADILTEAAQARALATADRRFDAQAVVLLQSALKANPNQQRARWFLGVAQRQAGDSAQAAATWTPLLELVDPQTATSLREQINLARADAGQPPLPEPAAPAPLLTVQVALDPALAARIPPDASVFVIVRATDGSPIPVAAQRHAVSELPFTAHLSDADSPMPARKLSQARQVEVLARISLDGSADAAADAPESRPVRLSLPASAPVQLLIGAPR